MAQTVRSSLAHLPLLSLKKQITVGILHGRYHKELTEFIARLALRGPFHFIVGGEWLPDQDSLRRAVRRHTTEVDEVLDHPMLGRPSTCLQLRDQLLTADDQPNSVFILNFLHHFYDPDVNLSLRQRVWEECCSQVQVLAYSKPIFILVKVSPLEEYENFFPLLASIAGELIEIEDNSHTEATQPSLL